MEKIRIIASDGYALSALFGKPTTTCIGTVVLSSATCVKKEFYINFGSFLVRQGYQVLLYDYRGIGESAPGNIRDADISMHEWGTKDMNAVLNYLVHDKGLTDITWMGHSVGAQLVGFIENRQHIRKIISINAAVGYWGYFPFPMNTVVWLLWYVIGPLLIRIYGYGQMKKIGWGENLPKKTILEWREWCLSKNYYLSLLQRVLKTDRFYNLTTPMTVVYTSDDFIANDKTVSLMTAFFPNAPTEILKIETRQYTRHKVGHTGIFRKKFQHNLWPLLEGTLH
jgi:predicted alpha/beta hydrolase